MAPIFERGRYIVSQKHIEIESRILPLLLPNVNLFWNKIESCCYSQRVIITMGLTYSGPGESIQGKIFGFAVGISS